MNFKQVLPSFNNQDFWISEDDRDKRVLSVLKGNNYIEVLYAWPAGEFSKEEALGVASLLYVGDLVALHGTFEDNQRLNEGTDPLIINHGQSVQDKYAQRRLIIVNGARYYDYQGIVTGAGTEVNAQLECNGGLVEQLIKSLKEAGYGNGKHRDVECEAEQAEVDDPAPVDKGFNGKPLKHWERK